MENIILALRVADKLLSLGAWAVRQYQARKRQEKRDEAHRNPALAFKRHFG